MELEKKNKQNPKTPLIWMKVKMEIFYFKAIDDSTSVTMLLFILFDI